jgi:23S rRNA (uracil747-C5)-methyltransferase
MPYDGQVRAKQEHCAGLLSGHPDLAWLPPITSPEGAFRNKAKMVVAGSVTAPTLGILDASGRGVDLRDCGLHLRALQEALPTLAEFVTLASLTPYDVAARRGELKYVLATVSPTDELMVRFVTRSQEPVARIRKHLGWLQHRLPQLVVVTVNIQPEHKAILEGEREIVLTPQETLSMEVNDLVLHLRPRSFFQTNTAIAEALYREARTWVNELDPRSVWDLYCGVGGFALHLADGVRDVVGIEISADAAASATTSAAEAGLRRVRFEVGDATIYALGSPTAPELVIVNPPRRGIGQELAGWLQNSAVDQVLYSSCNAESLARDLDAMPGFSARRARLLDMFPNTDHYEVLVLLSRDR